MRHKTLIIFTTNPFSQLHVFGHEGDPVSVYAAEIGVLKESHYVALHGVLQSYQCHGLISDALADFLGDLPDKALEGSFLYEKFRGPLIAPDLLQSQLPRSESLLFLLRSRWLKPAHWSTSMTRLNSTCGLFCHI